MPILTGFDVAIGTTATWIPVTVVAVDKSRILNDNLPSEGREFRYWRLSVTQGGVTEEIEGRLLIAGPTNPSPPSGTVVVPQGTHRTWTRVVNTEEYIITPAGTLSIV